MKVETSNFGVIEIQDNKVISFAEKILGFEGYLYYTIIDSGDDSFYWLQSIEKSDLAFIIINPLNFIDEYEVVLSDQFREKLAIVNLEDVLVFTLLVVGDKTEYISTNLKAPLVINAVNNKAGQIILEKDYPTRYYIFKKKAVV